MRHAVTLNLNTLELSFVDAVRRALAQTGASAQGHSQAAAWRAILDTAMHKNKANPMNILAIAKAQRAVEQAQQYVETA